jgi:phage/plasmid-like protein (TIGR03299 family)
MAHAIFDNDQLAIGYTADQGRAWHGMGEHFDGPVPLEFAEAIFDYDVRKEQAFTLDATGNPVPAEGRFFLMCDKGEVVSPSTVTDRYEIIQNRQFIEMINGGILTQYDTQIETCGTLFNRARAFINLVVMEHVVKGDISPTKTRLLFSNGFDNTSYMACANQIRVVCNNTFRAASAQGKANGTLKKFKHTAQALSKVEEYAVDLAELMGAIKLHNDQLDHLAEQEMSVDETNDFLANLFDLTPEKVKKGGRGVTVATKKMGEVQALFEDKDDLQGDIARTRYAMLNAVTDWSDHDRKLRTGEDAGSRMWDGVWGQGDSLKQKAFGLLTR